MERENAYEEIGYRPFSRAVERPMIDPGAMDYLEKFPPKMSRAEGLRAARQQLARTKEQPSGNEARRQDPTTQKSAAA